MLTDLSTGWWIGVYSYKFVFKKPKLFIFPLLAAASFTIGVMLLFHATGIIVNYTQGSLNFSESGQHGTMVYLSVMIACYFIGVFSSVFFNVAAIFTVNQYLTGTNASIIQGISFAFTKMTAIIVWTLISGTVGLLLMIL